MYTEYVTRFLQVLLERAMVDDAPEMKADDRSPEGLAALIARARQHVEEF